MIWPLLVIAAFNIANAIYDAKRILSNKRIYHGISALSYLVLFGLGVVIFKIHLWKAIFLFISWCAGRQCIFEPILNTQRGLKFDYVSKDPKSIIDKCEVALWGYNGRLALLVYGIAFIASTILYLW